MKRVLFPTASVALLSCLLILSCKKEEAPPEQIRSIKTVTVSTPATGQIRKFTGVIFAVNYSYLSFEDVSGRVIKLNADIGDEVKKGEILAVLDKQKYELELKDAQAQLKRAEAAVARTTAAYDREKLLFKKKASFQQRLDAVEFQYKAALSDELAGKAAVGLAERKLRHTDLKSPFDGFIGERFIQPNEEVIKGEAIFRIDEKGELEMQFDVPENLRKRVNLDTEGVVKVLGNSNVEVKCKISYLGTAARAGNAFPAKAILIGPPPNIKPGMTAEVSLSLPIEDSAAGFIIPINAILMGEEPKTGFVFIYKPATSTVKKTKVHFGGSQGNFGIVIDGIKEGDIIATAGVPFLLDGMKVKLFKPINKIGE